MTFSVGAEVGILPVRDTGVVAVVHPNVEYDVDRDESRTTNRFPEPELFLLPPNSQVRFHERHMIVDGRGVLLICVYKNRGGRRWVRTTSYRIVNGHNMGRMPRSK
jgi:hypothetical protein